MLDRSHLVRRFTAHYREASLLALGSFLLVYRVSEIPGIHGDEAWIFDRVQEIAAGSRPLDGMNSYTGPLHQYLLWPLFELLGYRVEVLRGASALLNLLLIVLAVALARPFAPSPRWATAVGLLLVTSPCFVLYSRFGTEITSLVPFLCFLGLALAARAAREPARSGRARAAAGGICLGLASYTHALAAILPLSAAGAALCVFRRAAFANRALRWAAIGVVAGFSPRFFQLAWGSGTGQWSRRISHLASTGSFYDLLALPSVLGGIWNGDLLYQRFTGENQIPVLPYAVVALLVAAALWLASLRRAEVERRELGFVLFFGLLCFGSFAVASQLSLRYFLLPSLFLPQLLLVLARPRISLGGARARRLAFAAVIAIASLNTFYVARNYFVAFDRSGGRPSVFRVGHTLLETSNHFIGTETLYHQLVGRGVELVYAKDFIVSALAYHDRDRNRLELVGVPPRVPRIPPELSSKVAAAVYYNGTMVIWNRRRDPPSDEVLDSGSATLRRDPSFDPHFAVFVSNGAPAARSPAP